LARRTAAAFFLCACLLLSGCASRVLLQPPQDGRWTANEILHLHLDRSVAWQSLFAPVKMTVEMNQHRWSVVGSLQYLQGERIGLQFRQPYREAVGDFFLTPEEFIYWPPFSSPQVIQDMDTLQIGRLFALNLPNWDLRDVIPFPFGERSSGFQLDTVISSGDMYTLEGRSEETEHQLIASARGGEILQERVERSGRESLVKTFRHYVARQGWLVPTEVVCQTDDNRFCLTWKIKEPVLQAVPRGS
jgi:hypothetical protein